MKPTSVVLAILTLGPASASAQVAIGTISGSTSYSQVTGYVAYLDLRHGHFTPVVTQLSTSCRHAGDGQVSLLPTQKFQMENNTLLAITANAGPGFPIFVEGTCVIPDGVIISDSKLVNPGKTNGPVLYFTSKVRATITSGPLPRRPVAWAVAGATVTNNDCPDLYQIGTLLVKDRKPGVGRVPLDVEN